MDIENFVGRWTIRDSTTPIIDVGDQLHVSRKGQTNGTNFRCESSNQATVAIWAAVHDCQWFSGGGEAGYLSGTIGDASGDQYPLVITYAAGSPNVIRITVVAVPIGGGDVVAAGGGDGAGGAGGDDDPPK